jgi:hypothetical protein
VIELKCLICKVNKAVHCWECSMNLVKEAKKESINQSGKRKSEM